MAKKNKNTVSQSPQKEVKVDETEALKSQLARAMADYDNLRRRTEEEKTLWIKFSSQTIIIKLLGILDMLEKAQEHLKDQGLALAVGEFKKLLIEEGVEEVAPKIGHEFNHELHEVIETVEGEEKGKIAEVLVPGWKYKDGSVLRFAKVKVYN
jgi:molecular chaperone GrpE